MNTLSRASTHWLAGLLEGEGCFAIDYTRPRRDGSMSVYPTIYVKMTDLDVLETAQEVTGLGRINPVKKQQEHHRQAYSWRIHGRASLDIMEKVLPLMHTRRTEKILEILDKATV